MNEITIDADVCHKDGLCVMTCTYGIFQQEEKGTIPKIDDVMRKKSIAADTVWPFVPMVPYHIVISQKAH